MTEQEQQEYLDNLSDDELRSAIEVAKLDLQAASEEQRNSEWHEACFAGLLTYLHEAQSRGMQFSTRH